jgi:hypothetical protein
MLGVRRVSGIKAETDRGFAVVPGSDLRPHPTYERIIPTSSWRRVRFLLHAIAATIQTGRLSSHVIQALSCRGCRRGALRGIEATLNCRPMVALVLILRLLRRSQSVFRISDNIRSSWFLCLGPIPRWWRWRDDHILTHASVIPVVGVISVVVGNAAPPHRGVIPGGRSEIKTNSLIVVVTVTPAVVTAIFIITVARKPVFTFIAMVAAIAVSTAVTVFIIVATMLGKR